MKIKQQQNYSNNLNTTVLFNSSNSTITTTGVNSTMKSNNQTETQANNAEFINSQSITPTTIWTRSAAFKAAQSHDQSHFISDNIPLVSATANLSSYKRNSHHFGSNHHGHYQHAIGKIVKPIPVRPMSSSSSSSSTHSSLFNQQSSNAITGVLASLNRNQLNDHNLNATDVEIDSNNFSLIAKYFASFPATRLKSTSSSSTSNNQASFTDNFHHCTRHHHCSKSPSDLFQNRNHETPTPTLPSATQLVNQNKMKTFMPFKKQNQTNTKSHAHVTNSPASNSFQDLITPTDTKIQSTFILRSQSALSNSKSTALNNTDHLCTNFKRMIKLSDNQASHESDPASPLTAASNTPTFDTSNIDLSAYNETHANTFTFPNFECDFMLPVNHTSDNSLFNLQSSATTSLDQSTRFAQITMETRSTRKFLIKHHPYLQLNSNINNNSTNTNKLFNQQRPSINLIKMKKLCSKSKMNESINDTINTRQSGRLSRLNDLDESKLLKFTDTAPQINLNQLNQSNYSLRVKNSNCKNNSTKITKNNKTNNKKNNPIQNSSPHQTTNLSLNQEEWCCCLNGDLEHDDYDLNNCYEDCDDGQEEDSSGYYSSYHSVDLVSSSGGGSIIGDNKQDLKQENKTINVVQQVPAPQHHYNTRSNFLQQTNSNCSPNRTITATPSSLNNSISNKNNNTTPTTRLRYQQQLAAAAASAASTAKTSPNNMKLSTAYFTAQQANNSRFHEQYQLECDLDLDQIEND